MRVLEHQFQLGTKRKQSFLRVRNIPNNHNIQPFVNFKQQAFMSRDAHVYVLCMEGVNSFLTDSGDLLWLYRAWTVRKCLSSGSSRTTCADVSFVFARRFSFLPPLKKEKNRAQTFYLILFSMILGSNIDVMFCSFWTTKL